MKARLGKKTKGKLNTFLLFLGLSVMFWFLTKFSKDHISDVQAQIHLTGIPQGTMLIGPEYIPVRVQLKGTGFDYLFFAFNEPNIEIDVTATALQSNGSWVLPRIEANAIASLQFDRDIEVLLPSNGLTIPLDSVASKKVVVKIMANIDYDEGFSPTDSYFVVPDSVLVSGPLSVIDTISVIETENKSFTNVSQDVDDILAIKVTEDANIKVVPETVALSISVAEFVEDSRVVPIELINVPPDTKVQLFPTNVTVSYVIDFDNYKKIVTTDFKVVCDMSKANEASNLLTPEIVSFPKNAKNVTINTTQVEFIFIQ